jgi:hypothetical protein
VTATQYPYELDSIESHTFAELHRRWPDLPAPGRALIFDASTPQAQEACWGAIRRDADARTEAENIYEGRMFEPYCDQCRDRTAVHEPGEGCHQVRGRSTEAMSTNPSRVAASAGDDPLKTVPPHVYFEAVAGIVVPPKGWVSCPKPGHLDRRPSCKVTNTHWRCWSCGAGGSIIDFGAALYGLEPTGRGYWEIRDRLVADLEGVLDV